MKKCIILFVNFQKTTVDDVIVDAGGGALRSTKFAHVHMENAELPAQDGDDAPQRDEVPAQNDEVDVPQRDEVAAQDDEVDAPQPVEEGPEQDREAGAPQPIEEVPMDLDNAAFPAAEDDDLLLELPDEDADDPLHEEEGEEEAAGPAEAIQDVKNAEEEELGENGNKIYFLLLRLLLLE